MIRTKEKIKMTFGDKKALFRLSRSSPFEKDVLDIGVEIFLKVNLPFLVFRFILIMAMVKVLSLVQAYVTIVELCITLAVAYGIGQKKFRLKPTPRFQFALFWRVAIAKVVVLQSSFATIAVTLINAGLPEVSAFIVPFILILLFTPSVIGFASVHAYWAAAQEIPEEKLLGWNPDDNYMGKPIQQFRREREEKLERKRLDENPLGLEE
jgi:hypothetical protein